MSNDGFVPIRDNLDSNLDDCYPEAAVHSQSGNCRSVPTVLVPICKMNGRYLEISTKFRTQQLISFKHINSGSANDQANGLQIFTDFGR